MYTEPEIEDFKPKDDVYDFLLEPFSRDQWVQIIGDEVSIYYNNGLLPPEHIETRKVIKLIFIIIIIRNGPNLLFNGLLLVLI